jgi:hypothetical protein
MRSHRLQWVPALLAAIAAGCTTMGTGTGSTPTGGSPTTFSWKSTDGISGTISASMSNGKTYSGQYFQITKDTTVDTIGPLWDGWGDFGGIGYGRGYGGDFGWDYWGAFASPDFITHYTGRVVANLMEPGGSHMRCQFRLIRPDDGMNGGGIGQCQLPNGTTIDANFPKG